MKQEEIGGHVRIESHGGAVAYLDLQERVVRQISLWQIRREACYVRGLPYPPVESASEEVDEFGGDFDDLPERLQFGSGHKHH